MKDLTSGIRDLSYLQGRVNALREALNLVSRDYSTKENIDLEHQLRQMLANAEREIMRFLRRK